MSAGSGITHSEYNLETEVTQIFQIWILPDEQGGAPQWGTRPFPKGDRAGRFVTLASGFEGDDALPVRAQARVSGATLRAGESTTYRLGRDRKAYLVPAFGRIEIEGETVDARDGAAIADVDEVRVRALEDSEVVLVDVK